MRTSHIICYTSNMSLRLLASWWWMFNDFYGTSGAIREVNNLVLLSSVGSVNLSILFLIQEKVIP